MAFWNLRALMLIGGIRPPACAVTPEVLQGKAFQQALEQALRCRWWQQAEPDILLGSATIGAQELEDLAAAAGWGIYRDRGVRIAHYGRRIPRPPGPRKAAVYTGFFPGLLGERRVGQSVRLLVQLHRTGTVVLSDSPVRFTRPMSGPVRARFSSAYEFTLPPGSSFGSLFHRVAVVVGGAIEIEVAADARYEFQLAIPTRAELLAASIHDAGLSLSPSDKGLLAEGVAARLCDLEILREPLVLRCIEALTTQRMQYDVAELRKHFTEATDDALEEIAARLQNVRQVSRPLRDIASPKAYISPGMKFAAAGRKAQEADIVGLLGSEIWLGEAKTSTKWFTPEQIKSDVALAGRVRAAQYVMTCLEPVGDEARRVASAACEEAGVKLWILEGQAGELAEVPSPPVLGGLLAGGHSS